MDGIANTTIHNQIITGKFHLTNVIEKLAYNFPPWDHSRAYVPSMLWFCHCQYKVSNILDEIN